MAITTPEILWGAAATTSNSYQVFTTEIIPDLTTGTDGIASKVITTTSLNGKKVMMGIDVTSAYSDVAGEVTLQLSADGLNWTSNYATVIADSTPNLTGIKYGIVDLTSVEVPFYRLVFNSAGNNVGTSGNLRFKYIVPPSS